MQGQSLCVSVQNGQTSRKPNQITLYITRAHVRIFLLIFRTQRGPPLDEAGDLETHDSQFWLLQFVRKHRMSLLRRHLQAMRAEGTAVQSGGPLRNGFSFNLSLCGERFCCVRPGKVLQVRRPGSELMEPTEGRSASGALWMLGSLLSPVHGGVASALYGGLGTVVSAEARQPWINGAQHLMCRRVLWGLHGGTGLLPAELPRWLLSQPLQPNCSRFPSTVRLMSSLSHELLGPKHPGSWITVGWSGILSGVCFGGQ